MAVPWVLTGVPSVTRPNYVNEVRLIAANKHPMYLPSELRRANINPWAQNSLSYLVSRYYQYPALVGSVRSCREGNYACARSRCSVMAGIGVFKYIARKVIDLFRAGNTGQN